jgi:hypothetical protein
VRECDDILTDLIAEVTMLQADSAGQYPPDAQVFLANVVTLQELLADVFPPRRSGPLRMSRRSMTKRKLGGTSRITHHGAAQIAPHEKEPVWTMPVPMVW